MRRIPSSTKNMRLQSSGEKIPVFIPKLPQKKPDLSQPLIKSVGFKGRPLEVLDLTAGFGKDAFLLALAGCRVTALEREKSIFRLLKTALQKREAEQTGALYRMDLKIPVQRPRKRGEFSNTIRITFQKGSLHGILCDSADYLSRLKKKNRSYIYGPFFPCRQKIAQPKKRPYFKGFIQIYCAGQSKRGNFKSFS